MIKNTSTKLELKNQTLAKSTTLGKGDQIVANVPQLMSDLRVLKDDFTPVH
jgi:hypothetical protein